MNSFNTSATKDHYSITFETDDKNNYEEVERLCRRIIDNKAKTIPVDWIIGWHLNNELENYRKYGISRVQIIREELNKLIDDWWKENNEVTEGNYDSDEEYEEQMRCLDEN